MGIATWDTLDERETLLNLKIRYIAIEHYEDGKKKTTIGGGMVNPDELPRVHTRFEYRVNRGDIDVFVIFQTLQGPEGITWDAIDYRSYSAEAYPMPSPSVVAQNIRYLEKATLV